MTFHQNPKSADMVDPKCITDMLKLHIWVYIFTFLHFSLKNVIENSSESKIAKYS